MYLSQYVQVCPLPDSDDLLLSSLLTSAAIVVSPSVLLDLENNTLDPECARVLATEGILVADLGEERQQAVDLHRSLNNLRRIMKVAVVVNLDCNFRCLYCYEGQQKNKQYMTEETIDQLVRFLAGKMAGDVDKLVLNFYGGEPLLSTSIIARISEELQGIADQNGVDFEITLVSNGSLLTRPTVERLSEVGLKRAKITLDGPADNHNIFRPFKNGQPSFRAIVNNIRACCDLVEITIGGNYTAQNYTRFGELFAELAREGLDASNLAHLQFAPVLQVEDKDSTFCAGCASINEPWMADAVLLMQQEALAHGFVTPPFLPAMCMVETENGLTVNWNGDLYKCIAMVGHQDYVCGHVNNQGINVDKYHLSHWSAHDECLACQYLPLCYGGCRYSSFQRHGNMVKVDCRKPHYDRVMQRLIVQHYLHGQG